MRKIITIVLIFSLFVPLLPGISSDREGIPALDWGTSGNLIDFEGWPTTLVNNDTVFVDAQSSGSVEICDTFARSGSSSLKIDSNDDGYDIARLNITRMPFNGNYTFWVYLEEKGSETGGCELDWLGGETPDDVGTSRINWLRPDPNTDEWKIHNTTGYFSNTGNLSFGEWYNVTYEFNVRNHTVHLKLNGTSIFGTDAWWPFHDGATNNEYTIWGIRFAHGASYDGIIYIDDISMEFMYDPIDIIVVQTNHFEPSSEATKAWTLSWENASHFGDFGLNYTDNDGYNPIWSLNVINEYASDFNDWKNGTNKTKYYNTTEMIANLTENHLVEVYLHIHTDTSIGMPSSYCITVDDFETMAEMMRDELKSYGWCYDGGTNAWGHVKGMWDLNDQGRGSNYGVGGELTALKDAGCFGDFTGRGPTNLFINKSIYQMSLSPDDITTEVSYDDGFFEFRLSSYPLWNSNLSIGLGSTTEVRRISDLSLNNNSMWLPNKNWKIIHGYVHSYEPEQNDKWAEMEYFYQYLMNYTDGKYYRLHFVSQREAMNMVIAAYENKPGDDPNVYRNTPYEKPLYYKVIEDQALFPGVLIDVNTSGNFLNPRGIATQNLSIYDLAIDTPVNLSVNITEWSTNKTFKISATGSSNVNFYISNLTPGQMYRVTMDGSELMICNANETGVMNFDNDVWSDHTFVISGYAVEQIEDTTDQINALIPVLIAVMGVVIVLSVLVNGILKPFGRIGRVKG